MHSLNIAQRHWSYVIMACLGLLQLSDKINYSLHFCDKAIPDDKLEWPLQTVVRYSGKFVGLALHLLARVSACSFIKY